jgi:hypothetical protein
MRMVIRYSDSTEQAAILLATIGSRVRAAVPGFDDAVEFTWTGERWLAEDGRAVEIELGAAADTAGWSAAVDAAALTESDAGSPEWWGRRFRLPTGAFDPAAQSRQAPDATETLPAYLN